MNCRGLVSMSNLTQKQYLILDLGSQHTKAGYSGDGYPRFILPSVLGYRGNPKTSNEDPLIAYDAIYASEKEKINLVYPFEEKSRAEWDWKTAKELISSLITQLSVNPKQYNVIYIEPIHSNPNNTRRLVDLLEKKLQFQKVITYKQPHLILQELNVKSGLVIELGHSLSSVVAYYKGYEMVDTIQYFDVGGKIISEEFRNDIRYQIVQEVSLFDLGRIIDKYFYMAEDFDQEVEDYDRGKLRDYQTNLPLSGKTIEITRKRFTIPEGLFKPFLLKVDVERGFSEILKEAILACPTDTRAEILENVIISGGLSKLRGLDHRIKKEIQKMFPNLEINVLKHQKPEATAWIGADTLCSKGIPDSYFSHKRHLNYKLPAVLQQMYTEAVECESAKLWLASITMVEKALDALLQDINTKLTTKLTKLTFFLALREQEIISDEAYKWSQNLRVIKNWDSLIILSNTNRQEVSDSLDFMQLVLDIIYKPEQKPY